MARKKRNTRQVLPTYAVILDGKTEEIYFDTLKGYLKEKGKTLDFQIKPELPQRKSPKQVKELIEKLRKENYDQIYWIVDFDQILHNNHIKDFTTLYQQYQNTEQVQILVNNPCWEIWFLLHFKFSEKPYSCCKDVGADLEKESGKKYSKKRKELIKFCSSIFDKTEEALKNAKKIGDFTLEEERKTIAEVYKLISFLWKESNND